MMLKKKIVFPIVVFVFFVFQNCTQTFQPQFVILKTENNLRVDSVLNIVNSQAILTHTAWYYSFETQSVIPPQDSASTLWDIRVVFSMNNNYPTIQFNGGSSGRGVGGAYLTTGILDTLLYAQDIRVKQDQPNNPVVSVFPDNNTSNSWFKYDAINNFIYPVPQRFLVIRTANRKWAKMEVLSFYKNSNSTTQNNLGYFSFRYVFQPNGTPVF